MVSLFETFTRTALREVLPATAAQLPTWNHCPRLNLDVAGDVRLKPDLGHWPHGHSTFIGDVKYKRDTGSGHCEDIYQRLAYATATRLREGTLIYADEMAQNRTLRIPGADLSLHIRRLDLEQPPTVPSEQVARLAAQIKESSAASVPNRG